MIAQTQAVPIGRGTPGARRVRGASLCVYLALIFALVGGVGGGSPAGGQTTGEPGAAGALASGDEGALRVTAVPRWGNSFPGQWTSYAIAAVNPTGSDFSGTISLVPRPAPATTAISTTTTIDVQRVPSVVAIGEIEFSVPEPTGPQGQPAPTPEAEDFPTYRARFALAGRSDKTSSMVVLEAPFGYRAELRDQSGRLVALSPGVPAEPEAPGKPPPTPKPSYAVLADIAASGLGPEAATQLFGEAQVMRSAADLPRTAIEYSGLQALAIDRFDVASLSDDQRRAMVDFVGLGGTLVLAGTDAGRSAAASLPDDFVPLVPTGLVEASLNPLADLVGRTTDKVVSVLAGTVRHGVVAMDTVEGVPLVVQSAYGLGRVVQLTYDPLSEPVVSDALLRVVGWSQGVGRSLTRIGGIAGGGASAEHQLWAPALGSRGWPGWPRPGLLVLVAYAAIGFPLAGLAMRRWGKRSALWVAAPVVALLVTGAVGTLASGREGATRLGVEVHTATGAGTVLVDAFRGTQATGKGEIDVDLGDDVAASTVFAGPNPFALPAETFRFSGPGGGVLDRSSEGGKLALRAEPGQVRAFQSLRVERSPMLESHLKLVESGPPEEGGAKVVGTVTNRSDQTVHKLRAQMPEGGLARLADSLGAGDTIDVEATFVWPGSIQAGMGLPAPADEVLLYAASRRLFGQPGQVAVAGIVGSPSAGPGASTTVAMELATFESDDGSVSNRFARVTQVASPSASGTFNELVAFEHSGSDGLGPLGLSYSTYNSPPEVYDWVSRTWRLMAPGNRSSGVSDTLAIRRSEVGPGGLVRTRSPNLGGPGGPPSGAVTPVKNWAE